MDLTLPKYMRFQIVLRISSQLTVYRLFYIALLQKSNWCDGVIKTQFINCSHSSTTFQNQIFISGGLKNSSRCEINEKLIIFNLTNQTITYEKVSYHPRFSHTSHITGDGILLLVGGISTSNYDVLITCIDLKNYNVTNFQASIPTYVPMAQHCSFYEDSHHGLF